MFGALQQCLKSRWTPQRNRFLRNFSIRLFSTAVRGNSLLNTLVHDNTYIMVQQIDRTRVVCFSPLLGRRQSDRSGCLFFLFCRVTHTSYATRTYTGIIHTRIIFDFVETIETRETSGQQSVRTVKMFFLRDDNNIHRYGCRAYVRRTRVLPPDGFSLLT